MNPNGNNGTGAEFGGQGSSETEAKDRYDIKLRGVQQELLERVVAANPKTIVVLMNAGCLALNASLVPAVLASYYPGELGGEAIADALSGVVSPAGRLPITYYPAEFTERRPMQEYDVRAHGGITYRFYEGTPLWEFGFGKPHNYRCHLGCIVLKMPAISLLTGLSYTTFKFALAGPAVARASTAEMSAAHRGYYQLGGGADVSALAHTITVTNTGGVTSDVVVLGFLRNPNATGPARNPVKELYNFERVKQLQPGASRTVRLSVPAQVLSLVDEHGTERLLPGRHEVEFGVDGAAEGEALTGGAVVLTGPARGETVFEMPRAKADDEAVGGAGGLRHMSGP